MSADPAHLPDRDCAAAPAAGHAAAVRQNGLDWLRVAATLGVLVLHAGIAYMPHPLPGLRWSTQDTPTPAADVICWTLDAWVMPVFFLLGGMAAASLLERMSPGEVARHRLRRLGGPLLLGCMLVLPCDLYVWLLGSVVDGELPLRKLQSMKLRGYDTGLWGPSHLWFLQYLLGYCLLAATWRHRRGVPLAIRPRRDRVRLAACVAASVAALAWKPSVLIGFDHQPLPQLANAVFFGAFFVVGLTRPRSPWSRRRSAIVLGFGCAVLAVAAPGLVQYCDGGPAGMLPPLFAIACWGLGLGAVEWARTVHRPLPRSVKTVAAASFWIYLAHHPIVGLAQISLKAADIGPNAKFALTAAVGLTLPLLTYVAVVRGRWIGRVLGERTKPASPTPRRKAA